MKKCVYLTALIFLCVGAAIAAPKNAFEIDAKKMLYYIIITELIT